MGYYFVGTDIGTSGTKSVILDTEGNVLASKYITYPLITPRPGWAEHNADDYWNAVADTIKACIEKAAINAADIKAVALSGFSPACILIGEDGSPLQNSHIWMDRRGTKQANWIKENIGYEAFSQKNPNQIDPFYCTIKLMWERDNRPELYNRAKKVLTAIGYPLFKLTGNYAISYQDASTFGVGFDIIKRDWDYGYLERLGLRTDLLPTVFSREEIVGYVTPEASCRTGLEASTPVIASLIDAGAAAVTSGDNKPNTLSITMGTAGCMTLNHKEPIFSPELITSINCREGYTTAGAIAAFGSLTRYFRDEFGQYEMQFADTMGFDVFDLLNLEAEKAPAGSDGLVFLPYVMGERTPIWDPLARGMLFGLSLTHTKGHMLRAFMEGAVYGLYHNFECMMDSGLTFTGPIHLMEGGAKSNLWRQIIADVFNHQVVYQEGSKGAPYGDAVLAGISTGYIKDLDSLGLDTAPLTVNEPNEKRHDMYMEFYKIYRKLYENTREQYRELASITGYN